MTYNLFFVCRDTLERIFLITKTLELVRKLFTRMRKLVLRKSVVIAV